jgi:hypothetical protein
VGLVVPYRVSGSGVDRRDKRVAEVQSSCTPHIVGAYPFAHIATYVLSHTDGSPFGSAVGAWVVPGFEFGCLWWVCVYRRYVLPRVLRQLVEALWKWCLDYFCGGCLCWDGRRVRLYHRSYS